MCRRPFHQVEDEDVEEHEEGQEPPTLMARHFSPGRTHRGQVGERQDGRQPVTRRPKQRFGPPPKKFRR